MAIDFKAMLAAKAVEKIPVSEEVKTVQSKGNAFLEMLAKKAKETKVDTPEEIAIHNEIVEEALPTVRELSFIERMKALKAGNAAGEIASKAVAEIVARQSTVENDIVHGLKRIVVAGNRLNDDQMLACKYAMEGQSCVITGAAGTGKTTAQAGVVQMLMEQDKFATHDFKYIGTAPSIAIVAFTKVAVRNIAKAINKNPAIAHFSKHCMTIHALLEYEPVVEERIGDDDLPYEVRVFRPMRNRNNPLTITHLVVEEASMVGATDLWQRVFDALLPGVQVIFLGDINQLQPVFGRPVLGYALCKLPVIELTEVYRQALDNPIIANAHRVLKGQNIESSADGRCAVVSGKMKVKVGQEHTAMAMMKSFKMLFESGEYNPETDMILSPWNKKPLGTINLNEGIATFLGAARHAMVQEVRAGFSTWWLAEGDKVLVDKRVGRIIKIASNPKYVGGATKPPGSWTRSGVPILGGKFAEEVDFDAVEENSIDYSNFSLGDIEAAAEDGDEYKSRAASHQVYIVYDDQLWARGMEDGFIATKENWNLADADVLESAGDFRKEVFQFAYCMTVHKSQGSEWRKVFFVAHYDHAVNVSREMLYTALTRAREIFVAFCKEDFLAATVKRAEIQGESLEAKIEYFNKGIIDVNNEDVPLIPTEESHTAMLEEIIEEETGCYL